MRHFVVGLIVLGVFVLPNIALGLYLLLTPEVICGLTPMSPGEPCVEKTFGRPSSTSTYEEKASGQTMDGVMAIGFGVAFMVVLAAIAYIRRRSTGQGGTHAA